MVLIKMKKIYTEEQRRLYLKWDDLPFPLKWAITHTENTPDLFEEPEEFFKMVYMYANCLKNFHPILIVKVIDDDFYSKKIGVNINDLVNICLKKSHFHDFSKQEKSDSRKSVIKDYLNKFNCKNTNVFLRIKILKEIINGSHGRSVRNDRLLGSAS